MAGQEKHRFADSDSSVDLDDLQSDLAGWHQFYVKLMKMLYPSIAVGDIEFFEYRDQILNVLEEILDEQNLSVVDGGRKNGRTRYLADKVLLDIALAVVRGENDVVADKIELLRGVS